ncbi:TonB family protein [Xanthobacter sp. TB0136]|uniref:TonB family protein n=1 Tax=Xanthobacter sp. TB0136 TaxID=3459177 RepID=UPI00403A0F16
MSGSRWHDFDRINWPRLLALWAVAGLFVLILHSVAVYAALFWQEVEPVQSPPAAVMVELAPLPVSADTQEEDVAPGPPMEQAPDVEPVDKPDEKPDEEPPPPEPVQEKVDEEMPELKPAPVPSQVVLPEPKPREVAKPVEKPKPRREQPKPKEEARPKPRKPAPQTSAAPRSDAQRSNTTAAPSQGASASNSRERASWASRVSAHLNRFKRYPAGAAGATGRPVVRFTLNGSGQVTSASLVRSSGSAVLDQEAVATVRRASPFPRPPDGQGASFSVPVNFTRR